MIRGSTRWNRNLRKDEFLDSALRWIGIVLVSATLLSTMAATDPSARFEDLGHRMMCTCGCNQVLLECNHVGCPTSPGMRDELKAGIEGGGSDPVVLASFVQKYGRVVLAAPAMAGFSWVAWIMPFLVLTLGLTGVLFIVRRWRLRTVPIPAATPESEKQRNKIRRDTEL